MIIKYLHTWLAIFKVVSIMIYALLWYTSSPAAYGNLARPNPALPLVWCDIKHMVHSTPTNTCMHTRHTHEHTNTSKYSHLHTWNTLHTHICVRAYGRLDVCRLPGRRPIKPRSRRLLHDTVTYFILITTLLMRVCCNLVFSLLFFITKLLWHIILLHKFTHARTYMHVHTYTPLKIQICVYERLFI